MSDRLFMEIAHARPGALYRIEREQNARVITVRLIPLPAGEGLTSTNHLTNDE